MATMTRTAICAEELLMLFAYGFEHITMPNLRTWDESWEGWLYRHGLLGRVHYLEKQKLLLRERRGVEWVYTLTQTGRATADGGQNPEARWQRAWDGAWRQLVFDLPVSEQRVRVSLLRWLRRHHFGYLQDSVWISPDPVGEIAEAVKSYRDQAEAFTILECRCARGFSNAALVRGAWRFDEINRCYDTYRQFANGIIRRLRSERLHPRELFATLRQERVLWKNASQFDPFLPRQLWTRGYGGEAAWSVRRRLLAKAARQLGR